MDLEVYVRFLLALLAVLALIAALTWAVRRFGFGGYLVPNTGKFPRLSVVEVKSVDPRRKLILVRCDQREYLVLLGTGQDLLLERNIGPPPSTAATSADGTNAPTSARRGP